MKLPWRQLSPQTASLRFTQRQSRYPTWKQVQRRELEKLTVDFLVYIKWENDAKYDLLLLVFVSNGGRTDISPGMAMSYSNTVPFRLIVHITHHKVS